MATDNNVVYLDGKVAIASRPLPEPVVKLLDALRVTAVKRLGTLLDDVFAHVDDAFFDLADRADNNTEQTAYFDAMREVRLRRDAIDRAFAQRVNDDLVAYQNGRWSASLSEGSRNDDALALVENDELEESLAMEGMASKGYNMFSTQISHLAMRLARLLHGRQSAPEVHPLEPEHVCAAFRSAASVLSLGIGSKLIFYKLFDRHVVAHLGGLYDELNGHLVRAGVLRDIETGTPRRPPQQGPAGTTESLDSVPARPESVTDSGVAAQMFQNLRELLSYRRPAELKGLTQAGQGFAGESAPAISPADVVNALSLIQTNRIATDEPLVSPRANLVDVRAVLARQIQARRSGAKALGPVESDIIDMISMLFDFVLDDRNVPDRVRALIARLQIPMLKVALLDRSFFGKRQHPARLLLNELAAAGIGLDEHTNVERDARFAKIEQIVQRVLSEFQEDISIFAELVGDLRGFIEQEQKRAQVIERRTQEAEEGKLRVESARAAVDSLIAQRLAGREVPQVVQTMLRDAWTKVLFIAYLKEGPSGEAWRRNLRVLDKLLWSVAPKRSYDERKALIGALPGLLQELREGLAAISYSPFDTTKLFQQLEQSHMDVLKEQERPIAETPPSEPTAPPAPPRSQPVAKAEPSAAPPAPSHDEQDQELDELLGGATVGAWFEFTAEHGHKTRAKLSAKLNRGAKYIFVNRTGLKVAEKTRRELAVDLREGKVAILDDSQLFDRALESVITSLRHLKEERE